MIDDSFIIKMMPTRGRSLEELQERVGNITNLIDSLLGKKQCVRILEVGFGFGTVLAQLMKLYNKRVELFGICKDTKGGDWALVKRVAVMLGIFSKAEIELVRPPQFVYQDVTRGLPFPDDFFDLIYSQYTFFYFQDKIQFLKDLNRVLNDGGIAKIDARIKREELPKEYSSLLEIWADGRVISSEEYLAQFENVELKMVQSPSIFKVLRQRRNHPFYRSGRAETLNAYLNMFQNGNSSLSLIDRISAMKITRLKNAPRPYLEMKKSKSFNPDLEFITAIDLDKICTKWRGTKSIYRIKS